MPKRRAHAGIVDAEPSPSTSPTKRIKKTNALEPAGPAAQQHQRFVVTETHPEAGPSSQGARPYPHEHQQAQQPSSIGRGEHLAGPSNQMQPFPAAQAPPLPSVKPKSQQFQRVRVTPTGKYEALIPSALTRGGPIDELVKFGALFFSPAEAAKTADKALIAMWGLKAAQPHLNFPIEQLEPLSEVHLRYGADLSAYLASLAAPRMAKKKPKTFKHPPRKEWSRKPSQTEVAIRSIPGLENRLGPCGVCPECRQPWLSARCRFLVKVGKLGYNPLRIPATEAALAALAANAAQRFAASVTASGGGGSPRGQGEEATLPAGAGAGDGHGGASGTLGTGAAAALPPPTTTTTTRRKRSGDLDDLFWIENPTNDLHARGLQNKRAEGSRKALEKAVHAEDAAAAAAALSALTASRPPALPSAPDPKDRYVPGPYHDIVRAAQTAAKVRNDVALKLEDDRDAKDPWLAEETEEELCGERDRRRCMLCYGPCHSFAGLKLCPVVQAGLAVPRRDAATSAGACESCGSAVGADDGVDTIERQKNGCKNCRKKVPKHLWVPPAVHLPWVDRLMPATLEYMQAVQGVANAAVVDFDRPEVSGRLSPAALLAIGLLMEENVVAELTAKMGWQGGGGALND